MDLTTQRVFIFLDEWLWIWLLVYLQHRWSERCGVDGPKAPERVAWRRSFWVAAVAGVVANYLVAYPLFFAQQWAQERWRWPDVRGPALGEWAVQNPFLAFVLGCGLIGVLWQAVSVRVRR